MNTNRTRMTLVILLVVIIVPALSRMTSNDGLQYIRTVDALQLLATGVGLGVALMLVLQLWRARR